MISRYFNPLKLLNKGRSVLLLGPRGTGKSALMKSALSEFPQKIVIDLLRGNQYQRYLQSPHLFGDEVRLAVGAQGGLLIVAVDEVQKVPALLDEVHSLIEEFKPRLSFFLTGSSARKLRRNGANTLAGRAAIRHLHPLSQIETDLNLKRALQFGTLPGIYLGEDDDLVDALGSYVSTYLREEIQQEAIVRGIDRFARFLDFAGQINGEPVNFAKIGKQTGVAGKTAAQYFGILVDTLVVHEIPGWSESVKKQLLQASKFYFFDCGVLNAINGYLRVELKQSGYLYGRLFETFVINQLIFANSYFELDLKFFHWRDKNGKEVDLILARNVTTPLLAIEIKSGSSPTVDDVDGFQSFSEDYPKVKKICICTTPRSYKKKDILFMSWKDAVQNLPSLALLDG
jgi:predicted AAA+ superfamily ATPase